MALPEGKRLRDLTTRQRWLALGLFVLVAAPFVLAVFQARADGWYPTGDNGTMLTTARQVFTSETPLTGEVASATKYGGHPYHPGPMVYYVLAPFVEVFGNTLGMLLGAAFVSVVSLFVIGYAALRTAGMAVAAWAWVTALVMCWSFGGTAFFYSPFKTISALLVIVAFLHLSTALVAGHSRLLPLWVAVTSFPIAATMRYALPNIAIAGVVVLLILALRWRRATTGAEPVSGFGTRVRTVLRLSASERRSVLLGVLVGVVCWWAPIYEALIHRGGNFRELYRGSRAAAHSLDGVRLASGELAKALLFHPVRTGAAQADLADSWRAMWLVGPALFLLLGAALIVWLGRRSFTRAGWAYILLTGAALFFTFVSLATAPADEGFGDFRTLGSSPMAAYATFTVGLLIVLALRARTSVASRTPTRALQVVAIGSIVLATLAVAIPGPLDPGIQKDPWQFEATRTLVEQAGPRIPPDEGRWVTWVNGGRTTPNIFVGFKAGLETYGIDTGRDAGAPGLRTPEGRGVKPNGGTVLLQVSDLPAPGSDWEVVATYDPPGRSEEAAMAVAERLVDFARETNPTVLGPLEGALPRILCPDNAAQGYEGDCPEADEILAADNPVAELPPAVVALVYLSRYGEDTQYPVIDGEKPPQELLDEAGAQWDDAPLTVYAQAADGTLRDPSD